MDAMPEGNPAGLAACLPGQTGMGQPSGESLSVTACSAAVKVSEE